MGARVRMEFLGTPAGYRKENMPQITAIVSLVARNVKKLFIKFLRDEMRRIQYSSECKGTRGQRERDEVRTVRVGT
jgi:hypothetical protein